MSDSHALSAELHPRSTASAIGAWVLVGVAVIGIAATVAHGALTRPTMPEVDPPAFAPAPIPDTRVSLPPDRWRIPEDVDRGARDRFGVPPFHPADEAVARWCLSWESDPRVVECALDGVEMTGLEAAWLLRELGERKWQRRPSPVFEAARPEVASAPPVPEWRWGAWAVGLAARLGAMGALAVGLMLAAFALGRRSTRSLGLRLDAARLRVGAESWPRHELVGVEVDGDRICVRTLDGTWRSPRLDDDPQRVRATIDAVRARLPTDDERRAELRARRRAELALQDARRAASR